MSDQSPKDVYHCPKCGWEWGGHDRAPPKANCPKCGDAMMRRGPADEVERCPTCNSVAEDGGGVYPEQAVCPNPDCHRSYFMRRLDTDA